jgi:hypothetical protein
MDVERRLLLLTTVFLKLTDLVKLLQRNLQSAELSIYKGHIDYG